MNNILKNILLAVLFTITIIMSLFSLTVLNDNYVTKILKHNKYYELVKKDLDKDFQEKNLDKYISLKKVEMDINHFVKKNYNDKITFKIDKDNKTINEIYNYHIKFQNKFANTNFPLIRMFLFIGNIILIVICGQIFLKTKKKHDIYLIFIISFSLIVLFYGISYLFINIQFPIIDTIKNHYLKYLLGVGIIFFEIGLYQKIKVKINRK